jgi:hypothetical protein
MVVSCLWLSRTIICRVEAIQAIVPNKVQGMYCGCLCTSGIPAPRKAQALNSLEMGIFTHQTGAPSDGQVNAGHVKSALHTGIFENSELEHEKLHHIIRITKEIQTRGIKNVSRNNGVCLGCGQVQPYTAYR